MKKRILYVILFIMMLGITGCNTKEEMKTLTCTRNVTVAEGTRMELWYQVTYTGHFVEVIETEEKIISDNMSFLETSRSNVEKLYSPYKNVEHYDYDVQISGDTLTSKTRIDYSQIDTNQMLEIDSANEALIHDGKVKINDIKLMYESLGATCK